MSDTTEAQARVLIAQETALNKLKFFSSGARYLGRECAIALLQSELLDIGRQITGVYIQKPDPINSECFSVGSRRELLDKSAHSVLFFNPSAQGSDRTWTVALMMEATGFFRFWDPRVPEGYDKHQRQLMIAYDEESGRFGEQDDALIIIVDQVISMLE